VDLDGTLIKTDVLFESTALLLRRKPWLVPMLPVWLASGRAAMKRKIAEQVSLDASLLPYNTEFLAWIESEKEAGRRLVLATASDQLLAEAIERHLEIFDEVLGSDGEHNIKGAGKLEKLKQEYGTGFAYAGNSSADLPVWRECREAIVVNASPGVLAQARAFGNVTRVFEQEPLTPAMILSVLRWKDWLRNLLIFAAPLAYRKPFPWWTGFAAFLAFTLCGSGAAILSDLLFLEPDRRHAVRSSSPIATGAFPIALAFCAWPVLLALGAGLGLLLPPRFGFCLAAFIVLSVFYSRHGMISPLVLRLAAGWFAFIER
jgi:phosphoserine phosphatase